MAYHAYTAWTQELLSSLRRDFIVADRTAYIFGMHIPEDLPAIEQAELKAIFDQIHRTADMVEQACKKAKVI